MLLKNNNRNGFSLLELLLVVSVGILLILAGLAIYRNISNQRTVTESVRLLTVLKQETQKLYQGEGTYGAGSKNAILINSGAVPSGNVLAATDIRSEWAQTVVVGGANTQFTVTFARVPQEICIGMGTAYTDNDPDFTRVTINGTQLTAPTLDTVNAECIDGDNGMQWVFR